MLKYVRASTGQMLAEYGIFLTQKAARVEEKLDYFEPWSRHRTLFPVDAQPPRLAPTAQICLTATLIANVQVEEEAMVGAGTVLNGLSAPVRLGRGCIIGDMTTVETHESQGKLPGSANLSAEVLVGDKCRLGCCVIDEGVTIGNGCVVNEGAVLERGVTVLSNSLVPNGAVLRANTLYGGSPVQALGPVSPAVAAENARQREELRANFRALGAAGHLLALAPQL